MRTRTKVLLPALLFATIAVAATATAGADNAKVKSTRDTTAIMADINAGKAKKLDTPQSKIRHTTGVWNGCSFDYLTTKLTDWVTDRGEHMTVSEDPDPKPPKDKTACPVDRNPTDEEMAVMRATVAAANATGQPADIGLRPIPPEVVAAQNSVGK
jgi:hypothetical protein